MSKHTRIEEFLCVSFEDFKLSQGEKYSLRELLDNLGDNELLSFARNKAFDLYREYHIAESGDSLQGLNWLEKVIKTIDNVRLNSIESNSYAYFSPGPECARQIINCLHGARETIDICVFTISDNHITDAILSAHETGKSVRIVSDNDKAKDSGSDIYYLAEKGVPVRLDKSPYHMHHKFAIFDQNLLINGSFNWTRSATMKNEENITVLHDSGLIGSFLSSFEELWSESKDI